MDVVFAFSSSLSVHEETWLWKIWKDSRSNHKTLLSILSEFAILLLHRLLHYVPVRTRRTHSNIKLQQPGATRQLAPLRTCSGVGLPWVLTLTPSDVLACHCFHASGNVVSTEISQPHDSSTELPIKDLGCFWIAERCRLFSVIGQFVWRNLCQHKLIGSENAQIHPCHTGPKGQAPLIFLGLTRAS